MSLRRRSLLLGLVAATALTRAAAAAPPKGAAAALLAWREAVQGGRAEAIAALVPEGAEVLFRIPAHPKLPAELRLSRAGLLARLQGSDARALGLHKDLLLPSVKDLRKGTSGRYRASHPHCPEVTWLFAATPTGRWLLVEVQRKFLEC